MEINSQELSVLEHKQFVSATKLIVEFVHGRNLSTQEKEELEWMQEMLRIFQPNLT
jgi:hypothetical protein